MIIINSSKNKPLLGSNNRSLNKRVLLSVDLNNSVLVIDLHYYSSLIANKLKYNSSFGQKWSALTGGQNNASALMAINTIFEPIIKLKRLIIVQKIVILSKQKSILTQFEKELLKILSSISDYIIQNKQMISALYSLAVKDKEKYLILTNNLDFWAICSKKSNIHHCMVIKNNNIRFYTDKFGLEYLSSLIRTNKLVNKLRLNKLKYVNLQYLFMLLLYVKFKKVKPNDTFSMASSEFLGSTGIGLKLLTEAHREISYCFLTKQSLVDIFLTSSTTHFILNLSQLLKITQFDIKLMSAFSTYYSANAIRQIPIKIMKIEKIYYKIVKRCKLYLLKDIPSSVKLSKKELPSKPFEIDISKMDTSMAIDKILQGLSW